MHSWFSFLVISPHLCIAIGLKSQDARVLNPPLVNGILCWLIRGVLLHEHIILNWDHSRIGEFDHVFRAALQFINKETSVMTKMVIGTGTPLRETRREWSAQMV